MFENEHFGAYTLSRNDRYRRKEKYGTLIGSTRGYGRLFFDPTNPGYKYNSSQPLTVVRKEPDVPEGELRFYTEGRIKMIPGSGKVMVSSGNRTPSYGRKNYYPD